MDANTYKRRSMPCYLTAKFNYTGNYSKEILSVKKGESLILLDDSNIHWYEVITNVRDGNTSTGFMPANYLAVSGTLDSFEWYFDDLTKEAAEEMLMEDMNKVGTYMVRPLNGNDSFALSVKFICDQRLYAVSHYKIHKHEFGFYIAPRQYFQNLEKLIENYSQTLGLSVPCFRRPPPIYNLEFLKEIDEIESSNFKFDESTKFIGFGKTNKIMSGRWIIKNILVAVKEHKNNDISAENFFEEAYILHTLNHQNIIRLYGISPKTDHLRRIYLEFMDADSLQCYLRKTQDHDNKNTDFIALMRYATQVAAGMAYLEKIRIVHRFLATRNILLNAREQAKISDFDTAVKLNNNTFVIVNDNKNDVKWSSPEAIRDCKFSVKSDVWSFGILLIEIFTKGEPPFKGQTNAQVKSSLLDRNFRLTAPPNTPSDISSLMQSCWNYDYTKRPNFEFIFTSLKNQFGDEKSN